MRKGPSKFLKLWENLFGGEGELIFKTSLLRREVFLLAKGAWLALFHMLSESQKSVNQSSGTF